MRRLSTTLLCLAVGTATVPLAAAPAWADERTCTGAIGAETVDDLRVPDGASCTLDGTVVEGNVVVGTGAALTARGVRVDGNVQAEGARSVTVLDATVGGSVQVKQGGGADVQRTRVTGDVQYDDMSALVRALANTVGGNVQPVGNRGGVEVFDNRIDGNLQCKENAPAPTGARNEVRGSAEEQCAGFTGTPQAGQPQQPGSRFCDTAGHTFQREIDAVAAAGIAQGSGGCFRPDAAVTRGQMAAFLQRGYRLADGSSSFCDTRGTTFEREIAAVAAAGIAQGAGGCYRPGDAVTRGQMATFLARAERLAPAASGFCDTARNTHEGAIGAVAAAGIAQGSGGCFRPADAVTRGQMAAFLARSLGL